MVLYGADTEKVRQLAENYRSCAQRMLETSGRLTATVTSVTWDGPDADTFRERWSTVEGLIHSAGDRVTERSTELDQHADEQDAASSPASERLGDILEGLRSGFGDVVDGFRDFVGDALDALGRGVDVGAAVGEDSAAASTRITPDDFDKERGADSSTDSTTITLPDGTEITVSESGGTQTYSMNAPVELEQKVNVAGLEVTRTTVVGSEFEVAINEDGSWTYTFTGTSADGLSAEEKTKFVDGKIATETSTESVYSVTVPAGTEFADAVAINPFNPASIPPGGSVTVGTGVEQSTSLDLTGKYRGLQVGLGLEETVGTEVNTVMARNGDGTLSMTSGPTNMVRADGTLSVGVEGAAFELGNSRTHEHGVLEYVQFSDDAAGNQAYTDALRSSDYPDSTSDSGVIDRYTQTHTSTSSESSVGFKIDKMLDVSRSHNTYADEVIHRSYPDGREEWAQQILPHGEGSGNSVYVHGGTGRETEYQMTLGDVPPIGDGSATSTYWGQEHHGGDMSVSFTQEELATMSENRAIWHGNPDQYRNETDYLASVVASASGKDADLVMQDLHRDYNLRPIESNNWHDVEHVHPEMRTPGQVEQ